jgi:chromosome segregation ATPase
METIHKIFMKAYNSSMAFYKRDVEDLTSRREILSEKNKIHVEYIQKVNGIIVDLKDERKEYLQLVKEYDEEILMYHKQVKEKDEEMKNKEHQMKEKDEEISKCKKQKREMEDELLTIASLSSLDELKHDLKKVKDLRESEEAEV